MSAAQSLTCKQTRKLLAELAPGHQALAELILNTGLRIGEYQSIAFLGIWTRHTPDELRIRTEKAGRGNAERIIPLNARARAALEVLSYRRRPRTRAFQVALKRAAERAGIAGRVSPHILRHTFATRLSADGVPTRVIQGLLGHQHLNSTAVYLHPGRDDFRSAVEGLRP